MNRVGLKDYLLNHADDNDLLDCAKAWDAANEYGQFDTYSSVEEAAQANGWDAAQALSEARRVDQDADHDGRACVEMRQLTDKGEELYSEFETDGGFYLPETGFEAMGFVYRKGDENAFIHDLWGNPEMCSKPRWAEKRRRQHFRFGRFRLVLSKTPDVRSGGFRAVAWQAVARYVGPPSRRRRPGAAR